MPEYCICRSSDGDRFMIECDGCDEWFHGDCINLKQSEAIRSEIHQRNPSFEITYKVKKESKTPKVPKSKVRSKKRSSPSPSATGPSKPPSDKAKSSEKLKIKQRSSTSSTDTDEETRDGDWGTSRSSSKSTKTPQHPVDKDKQNGGILGKEKTKKSGKKLTGNKATGKVGKGKPESSAKSPAAAGQVVSNGTPKVNGAAPLGKPWKGHGMPPPLPLLGSEAARRQVDAVIPTMPDIKSLPRIGRKSMNSLSSGYVPPIDPNEHQEPAHFDLPAGFDRKNLRQCFGPQCRFAAAPDSKYCSHECGRALAKKRLMEIMPKRLIQMGNPTYAATLRNQEEMDSIRKRLAACKGVLDTLLVRNAELEDKIRVGKLISAELVEQETDDDADNSEVSCITCGQSVSLKTAIKHFERCFNRCENQTSYGSIIPTTSTIFCNFLNPKTKTYCRRLKVLCPEHLKEVHDDHEVCGFPLLDDQFQPTTSFCRIYKKNCSKHPSWERIKRAEIDLETLRTWMKMDDLAEQERVLMISIRSRGGIVQCMTNYTINEREAVKTPFDADLDV